MVIESSPTNLDPRIGTDGQSEHIDALIFDALVRRDEHFNIQPWLAQSWETPDPLTVVFHLRSGVHFHDGRPLSSKDVQWTIMSILNGKVPTVKSQAYRNVDHIDTPDPLTAVFHLKKADPGLLPSLSDGAIGIVPAGSGRDFGLHPIGSGPFRFVSQEQDKEVVIERNPMTWGTPPAIERVRFAVVPDSITRALELQKGSADIGVNALTADQVYAMRNDARIVVESGPGTILNYISFNTRDFVLKDARVRQAIAFAINRPLIVSALWRGRARIAESLLPTEHWAWSSNVDAHEYDPTRANALLDAAGFKRGRDGVRFHLTIKTSTDETGRTLAVVLQQQLRAIGIDLEVRSFEFATFYADIAKGAFQMYTLRWIGGNEDPDIFRYAYATASAPPHGANRGYYSNPEFDALVAEAAVTPSQSGRAAIYAKMQQIVAKELPAINLWYLDTVIVHNRRLRNVHLSSSGTFDFLREATVDQ
ncbi:Oligopeptide ABC transporter, periplasmic oligopeptide-binding protein OppA [Acidisarcina polymorpha]|uniref:Oligopeptide ABC transporter, periplasmic oligopeptide-binding protein OppA n=2 Tax=Acidisarcina polymorpha TaxID=2211140 RepID=A0A2Z5G8N4_9BACT|nr:Oligopeptide ABC transporter, periplasmic oligopeptide-binding protein OppA [Acidisarcina polymorpha]